MRQISIKQLNKHLSAELNDLPFEITRNGKVIGGVMPKGTYLMLKGTDKKPVESTDKGKGTDNKVVTPKKRKPLVLVDKPWVNPLANSVLAPKA